MWRRRNRNEDTKLIIKELNLYPVKSVRGMSVKEWPIGETGLLFDRSWMIVGKNMGSETPAEYQMVTIRQLPRLWLIGASVDVNSRVLTLYKAENDSDRIEIRFDDQLTCNNRLSVDIWKRAFEGVDMGDEVSTFLERVAGRKGLRLVMTPLDLDRQPILPDRLAIVNELKSDQILKTSFADNFPYLIVTENSLDDVNSRLDNDVEMRRFRPNITIARNLALKPYEEETWKDISIVPKEVDTGLAERRGVIPMYAVSVCARCTIPNVDPETAKREEKGPSYVLRKYHTTVSDNPVFGINTIHTRDAVNKVIRVGDTIQIHSKHTTIQEFE